ncbi:MAG: V-type proton ATPase subunit E [Syntrophales bacterium]|jgi:vacuolar-type H+-ATPase subunit E/Vma4|nr:V-type proton ATPase subunit E [Syntrophales bacterium]MCK9527740.1 V-type proton ATPase subunit E [Syntrophales bacterium]MDX9921605.1 V-type ATP synthase subunit E family protein [Syntrophales bacterium]
METKEIREAILKKARDEAERIVAEAQNRASAILEQARDQKKKLLEEEKQKRIAGARREAAKILAQSTLKERQTVLREKDDVINTIIARVRDELEKSILSAAEARILLKEIVDAFESDGEIQLFVAPRDRETILNVVRSDDALKKQVADIYEKDMLGGIIAETTDGMISIDNSFERRLEMLIPKILPEIGQTLFGS